MRVNPTRVSPWARCRLVLFLSLLLVSIVVSFGPEPSRKPGNRSKPSVARTPYPESPPHLAAFPAPPLEPATASPSSPSGDDPSSKVSPRLRETLAHSGDEAVRVIVRTGDGFGALERIEEWAGTRGGTPRAGLAYIGASAVSLRAEEILELALREDVTRISLDERVTGSVDVSARAIGADQVVDGQLPGGLRFDGAGVTIAVIDSGVDASHPDLIGGAGQSRVISVDMVDPTNAGRDLFGHGTHVAGILGGDGELSTLEPVHLRGIAPKSRIYNLRVLDADGAGYVSDVIAAIGQAIIDKNKYNIRVINLSLGHPVYEPFLFDPLCLATGFAVQAGIAVVASAGNNGMSDGQILYGGVNSPGNAPWVITVGAVTTMDTVGRHDDAVAKYSSRGPTVYDGLLKPDLVAPGNRIVSLQAEGCFIASEYPHLRVELGNGDRDSYLQLSGTSMSTPMVSGTLALLFQANASLGPNAAKAILLYTAEKMVDPDMFAQGSGSLNAEGAVRMALAIRRRSEELEEGDFWLRARSEALAQGMILPYTVIDGAQVPFGAALTYGDGILWSNDASAAPKGSLWGSGILWSHGILWSNGLPWFDVTMGYKHPAFGNGILWSNGVDLGVLFSDGILWSNVAGIIQSDAILWTNSLLHGLWDPLLLDPDSYQDESGVLFYGEEHQATGYQFGNRGKGYYPARPPEAEE